MLDRMNALHRDTVSLHPEDPFLGEPELKQLKDSAQTILATETTIRHTEIPDRIANYQIMDRLGAGAFSVVCSARDLRDGTVVALKVLRVERQVPYDSEAHTLQSLNHPSIVRVLEWGMYDEGRWYLAMQYVEGRSLYDSLTFKTYAPAEAARTVAQIARALHHAHTRGFVHRDVKPANILIDVDGNPKVTDFGLAIHDDDQWDHKDEVAGTRPYMSPEQVRRESHRLDGRTDVWSLGVVLYEMLTGKRPFRGEGTAQLSDEILHRDPKPPRQIRDSIPRRLEQVCLRCLSKAMTDRYSTSLDLAEELEACVIPDGDQSTPLAVLAEAPEPATSVIPKGLCSFDRHDAEYFLRLLPGPRNGDGIPECVRFWTTRIEQRELGQTFSVGMIYGRSGCGKSSFVKAGLLPLLHQDVEPVYLEATSSSTQSRLLKTLTNRFAFLQNAESLAEAARMVRQQGADGKKVLIVLDQFEQYMHGSKGNADESLADALRQCDGVNLQCLLVVRDDFWMAISEFMRQLEIPQVEGVNLAPVQLFSIQHSIDVLTEFGRSYGQIPRGTLSVENQSFLSDAVDALAHDGQVVCLRLALFAHLMRNRSWVPATLRKVGGLEGLGIKFLDESFGSPNAPFNRRKHLDAASNVLSCLLPSSNDTIKGGMKSRAELLEASGYESDSTDFTDLMNILDGELRLITPIAGSERSQRDEQPMLYQLSHDYVVPSLRKWLDLRNQSTYRGRALLRLRNREQNWRLSGENRQLPSLWEAINIWLYTRVSSWTPNQQSMMRKAFWHHSVRSLLLSIPVVLLFMTLVVWRDMSVRLTRLLESKTDALPSAIDDVRVYRMMAVPALRSKARDGSLSAENRLRAAIALAAFGENETDVVIEKAIEVPVDYRSSIFASLQRDPSSATELRDFFLGMEREPDAGNQRAVIALLALSLGEQEPAELMTSVAANPTPRTQFIDRFPHWSSDFRQIANTLEQSENPGLRSAVCIGIGKLATAARSIPVEDRKRLQDVLVELYTEAADSATHSAADYALRQWACALPLIKPRPANDPLQGWIVTESGLHLLKVPAGKLPWKVGDEITVVEVPQFLMCNREVSRDLYEQYLQQDGIAHSWEGDTRVSPTKQHPVNSVSWKGAIQFLNWLSRREGLEPYYVFVDDIWQVPNFNGTGYRLPTELEWEYACRAGSRTVYAFGDDVGYLDDYATYGSSLHCTPCGSKIPNAWGFFDMAGNVWEWCQGEEQAHQAIRANEAGSEVLMAAIRGGAYDNPAQILRSDNRVELSVDERFNGIGFRIARTAKSPEAGP